MKVSAFFRPNKARLFKTFLWIIAWLLLFTITSSFRCVTPSFSGGCETDQSIFELLSEIAFIFLNFLNWPVVFYEPLNQVIGGGPAIFLIMIFSITWAYFLVCIRPILINMLDIITKSTHKTKK